MDRQQRITARKHRTNYQAHINVFFHSMISPDEKENFKDLAIKKHKEMYDTIQELKKTMDDENTSLQTFMVTLERYRILSKKLIIRVSCDLKLKKGPLTKVKEP